MFDQRFSILLLYLPLFYFVTSSIVFNVSKLDMDHLGKCEISAPSQAIHCTCFSTLRHKKITDTHWDGGQAAIWTVTVEFY